MKYDFSARAHTLMSSPLLSIRTQTRRGSVISLAEELPAEELFPLPLLAEAASTVISADAQALQYGDPEGYGPLREWLAEDWLKSKGVHISRDGVLLTTGSQQAVDLLSRVYIDPGDCVLVENPTSPGFLQALRMQGAVIIPVNGDREGLLPEDLREKIIRNHPKLLFAAPSFTNPSGILWSLKRRKEVLELCISHNVLILEDDSYGDLHFKSQDRSGRKYPSLYALEDASESGHVLYIGSFSKTVAPALRTGWAAGSRELINVMAAAKGMADWQSSSLNQRLLYHLLHVSAFDLRDHIALLNREYGTRLKLMAELLKRAAWKDSTYDLPSGGMFLWVSLPEGLDAGILLKNALRKGVVFLPGPLCTADDSGSRYIRLNFSHPGRDELLLGMNLMSEAVTEFTARS
ncbi:PLP-dependent aminotransferase family protein [Paenibacillus rhizophilus]|uniref:PLP-dependent aminotransferase family protein n=1 Tax=Paenibacillus rhizophilus TaxID=1850366 RepID=A0A3N9P8Z5_9BACL|nr:PLP-dependent aminotransferase family protein [Paenibacillus rhizophilus]RQW12671.1 PLP-dependent aminotransferase family protein [Paenibacillus rhizophilus]